MKKILIGIILLVTIFIAGCVNVGDIQYNTNCDHQKLLELKGEKVVLLSFKYNKKILLDVDALNPSTAQIVADHQKAKFLSEFNSLFQIKLFSWEDISRNDSKQFIEFLNDNLKIEWIENATINKSDDGKVITITKENNSLRFWINEEENKVNLEISSGEVYEYILKDENGKLNIYSSPIRDVSNNHLVLKGRKPNINNPEVIGEILQELDADGGIIVTNTYGYKMSTPVPEEIPEPLNGFVKFIVGPSSVEYYCFASDTYIVDEEGNIIWNFYGKVAMLPKVLDFIKPEEFTRMFIGLDPSEQNLVKAMIIITDHYTDYLMWLIQKDIDNSPNKNYFTYYHKEKKNGYPEVYPALDEHYVPYVREISDYIVDAGEEQPNLWEIAKSGDWSKFGQWTQAWAALEIFIIWLVLYIVFGTMNDLVGFDSKSLPGQMLAAPRIIVGILALIGLYYLLQAVL